MTSKQKFHNFLVEQTIQHGKTLLMALFVVSLLAVVLSIYASVGHAHDARHMSDWIRDHGYVSPGGKGFCCGEDDCGVLDDDAVKPVPGGYDVHGDVRYATPLTAFSATERVDEFWPANETLISQDMHYWRCRMGNKARCVFVPPQFSKVPAIRGPS